VSAKPFEDLRFDLGVVGVLPPFDPLLEGFLRLLDGVFFPVGVFLDFPFELPLDLGVSFFRIPPPKETDLDLGVLPPTLDPLLLGDLVDYLLLGVLDPPPLDDPIIDPSTLLGVYIMGSTLLPPPP
jgi:hypothetical protein